MHRLRQFFDKSSLNFHHDERLDAGGKFKHMGLGTTQPVAHENFKAGQTPLHRCKALIEKFEVQSSKVQRKKDKLNTTQSERNTRIIVWMALNENLRASVIKSDLKLNV